MLSAQEVSAKSLLSKDELEKFFRILSLMEVVEFAAYSQAAHSRVEHYLMYLQCVLNSKTSDANFLELKQTLLNELSALVKRYPNFKDNALFLAVCTDINANGYELKHLFANDKIEDVIQKHEQLHQGISHSHSLNQLHDHHLLQKPLLKNKKYPDIIHNLEHRTQLPAAFLMDCMNHINDGRLSRLILFVKMIESGELSVANALTLEKNSITWFENLLKCRPEAHEKFFADLNCLEVFEKCIANNLGNLEKILRLFPEKNTMIFDLLMQIPMEKFSDATPLETIEKVLLLFPNCSERLFQHVAENTQTFVAFAKDIQGLAKLVALFPAHKEDIYNSARNDKCFSHYYHYGLFSALGQLKILFPSHNNEISEISKKSKEVPHIQSLCKLNHNS